MTRDLKTNPSMNIDWKIYQDKMKKYEPTFQGMIDDFLDNIFGQYSNRASSDQIVQNLSHHGWKYFDQHNLNELFAITLERCGTNEVLDAALLRIDNDPS